MAQLRHFFNLNLKNLPSKVGRIFVLIASAGLVQHQKKHELASEDIEDVRNFGSKDIIGASNPGLYHDHENN